jgi:hypothetical protein
MDTVTSLDEEMVRFISEKQPFFYFGLSDDWCPLSYV